MPVIKVEKLSKIYKMGEVMVPALNNVSFSIDAGEMICIWGRSGSGKSTLLHMLGLIDTPTSGKIFLNFLDVGKLSESKRSKIRLHQIGFVFQEYALIPELTALENIYLPALMSGRWGGRYEDRALDLIELIGLGDRMNHKPKQLSGGEQQRVAIARAMVNAPEVIFADEPTANLDSVAASEVMERLTWLNREFGTTVIFVSHDPNDKKYAKRIITLHDGAIVKGEKS